MSSSSCLAVGQNAAGNDVLVPITHGIAGAAIAGPDQVSLSQVACVSASSCVAVGGNNGFTEGAVVPIANGVLGVAQFVAGTGFLNDVACDPSGACVATGSNSQFSAGVVVPITGGTAASAALVSSSGGLNGVTCTATGSCLTVGFSPDFASGVVVPIRSGVPGNAQPDAGFPLGDLHCMTAHVCTAAGFNGDQLAAVPIVDGTPGSPQSTTPSLALGIVPNSIACPTTALCLVQGPAFLLSGPTPAISPIVNGAPSISQTVTGTSFLGDLVCPTAAACVSVGATPTGQGAVLSFAPGTGAPATTATTVSPTPLTFGRTATATATVSSPAGTPGGEVFFTVDGIAFDYPQPLDGSGKTTFAVAGLAPGSHSITATYVGQPGAFVPGSTFFQSGSGFASPTVACAATITGQQNKSLNITAPATCMSAATVSGSVNVTPGASLSIDSSTIGGSFNASGAGVLRMCASTVGGSLSVANAAGYTLLGDRTPDQDDDSCAANTIHGSVSLVNDRNGVKAIGNAIGGSLNIADDSGRGGYPFDLAPELAPNTLTSTGHSTFLASRDTTAQGQPVDGIQCDTTEQVASHTHAHVAIFANGQPLAIPEGLGMVGPVTESPTPFGPFAFPVSGCLYWLHVHDQTGTIHMELPGPMTITLGEFFDIWGQPLSATGVGPQHGSVTAFVNGARYAGNPRDIVLQEHTDVQLDVGAPAVPPQPYAWDASH